MLSKDTNLLSGQFLNKYWSKTSVFSSCQSSMTQNLPRGENHIMSGSNFGKCPAIVYSCQDQLTTWQLSDMARKESSEGKEEREYHKKALNA